MVLRIVCLLIVSTTVAMASAAGTSIVYDDFSDLGAFTLNGEASTLNDPPYIYNGDAVLRLTDDYRHISSAFLADPIPLADGDARASFSTEFTFRITESAGEEQGGADGLAFVIQAQGPTALGNSLGYQGVAPSVAVEFDTYHNNIGWIDDGGNHLGVDLDGDVNSVAATPITPDFNNGAVWTAWIDYDAEAPLLEVRAAPDAIRPDEPLLTYAIDIVDHLGADAAWFGFSADTWGETGDHDIRTWRLEVAGLGGDFLLGDFDDNGALNGLDIPDFKAALADPGAWSAATGRDAHALGDFDGNGTLNGLDIPGFKNALAGAAVPEPTGLVLIASAILLGAKGRFRRA